MIQDRCCADRAGLVILQLRAQFLDAGAAGQALALQQLAGDGQGLLGDGESQPWLLPVLSQALTVLLGCDLALLQLGAAFFQVLLAVPQPGQVFDGTQLLFAVVLQQAAEYADLLGDGIRFGACLLE